MNSTRVKKKINKIKSQNKTITYFVNKFDWSVNYVIILWKLGYLATCCKLQPFNDLFVFEYIE